MAVPTPPPGFKLDAPSAASRMPEPPPGFVLDSPPSPPPGFTLDSLNDGPESDAPRRTLSEVFTDPARKFSGALLRMAGGIADIASPDPIAPGESRLGNLLAGAGGAALQTLDWLTDNQYADVDNALRQYVTETEASRARARAIEDAVRLAEGAPTLAEERLKSPLNRLADHLTGFGEYLGTEAVSEAQRAADRALGEAAADGFVSALAYAVRNPLDFASSVGPSTAAYLVPAGAVGRIAGAGGRVAGLSEEAARSLAASAGVTAVGATAAVQNASEVSAAILNADPAELEQRSELYRELVGSGLTPEQAQAEMATRAFTRTLAASGLSNAVTLGLAARYRANVLEDLIAGRAPSVGRGAVSGAVTGAAKETVTEMAQEGGEAAAAGIGEVGGGVRELGEMFAEVPGAAGIGAAAGAASGAVAGGVIGARGRAEQGVVPPPEPASLGDELAAALPDFDVEEMMGVPQVAEPPIEAQVAPDRRSGIDRRHDMPERKRVAEMTPEEMRQALLTHELTGIGNRRAYEESQKLPAQTSIDVDSLKWINDELGHEAGDELLRTVASALAEETDQAFHIGGDEFVMQAMTPEEADAVMQRVSDRLSQAVIEVTLPDGEVITVPGVGVSYGIGANLSEADTQLKAHKTAREQAGLRAARGEEPPGTTRRGGRRGPVEAEGREVEDQLAAPAESAEADPQVTLSEELAPDPQTLTPEFRRWFGDSKVVDENGEPLVVYHGTTGDIHAFDPEKLGQTTGADSAQAGFFFARDPVTASNYATAFEGRTVAELKRRMDAAEKKARRSGRQSDWAAYDALVQEYEAAALDESGITDGANVIPAYLSLQNPLVHDFSGQQWEEGAFVKQIAIALTNGNDGVIFKNVADDPVDKARVGDVYVAFRPEQIKSAIGNVGTFDPSSPDILAQEDRGPEQEAETFEQVPSTDIPETIEVDVVERPTRNSNGQLIHPTEEGIRNFWRWFGDSKVVEVTGEPLVVYHGSDALFNEFEVGRPSVRMAMLSELEVTSQGAFFSPSPEDAAKYGQHVRPFYLSVQRPLEDPRSVPVSSRMTPEERAVAERAWDDIEYILEPAMEVVDEDSRYIDYDGGLRRTEVDPEGRWLDKVFPDGLLDWHLLDNPEVVARLKERGYDGARVFEPNDYSGMSWFVVDPRQVKSTENVGTFDPASPDITQLEGVEVEERSLEELSPEDRRAVEMFRESMEHFEREVQPRIEEQERFEREMVEDSRREGREEAERRGLTEAVDALFEGAKNAPEVIYVADLAGLDPDARRRLKLSPGRRLRGAYDPKENVAYIVSSAHDSPAEAVWTVAHEVAGHAGFQGLITRGLLNREARQALVSARRLARQNPTIDRLATEIASRRSALRSERAVRQEQAAEEAIAELAAAVRTGNYDRIAERYGVTIPEAQRATLRGAIERFVQRVKQLLERMLGREGAFTDAQVWDLVEGAWRYVREGAPREPEAASVALSEDAPSERRASPERRAEPRGEDRRAERAAADTEKMAGAAYVPMYQGGKRAPLTRQAVALGAGQRRRTVEPPEKEPIRREHIMDLLQREFGMVVYQGKPFKFRQALGFFRPKNFEVRIKNKNDLEVTAHEVFHWLDRTYPTIRKLYHERRFAKQLKSISYDATKLHEGFAEFGRLYMTQEPEVIARAPEFYEAFVKEARKLGILDKLERVQRLMHEWYNQGAEARAKSKIGEKKAPLGERLKAAADGWSDAAIAKALDRFHAAKVIERETTGEIAEDAALSPYKSIRLLAGARSTVNTFLNYGTLGWTQEGDLRFTGKGLKQVFEPVADVMDETLSYFVGMRAMELRTYGKENLFTPDEINALLDKGRRSPKRAEIEEAFREYQKYTRRLLNFAQQSGILSAETRALWEEMYKNYVPFYRVADKLGGLDQRMSGTASLFKRLKGGTANVRDTWENITLNTALIVHASLKNVAKRQLFAAIEKSPVGQRYAVRIPTDTAARKVAMEQVERVLKQLAATADEKASRGLVDAVEAAQIAMLARALANRSPDLGSMPISEIQDQATFYFSGQPPSIPYKDSVLVKGKRVWYQIGDPLLWDMLVELNYHKPLELAEQILGLAKRTLTRGVTITPDFQIANIVRDTFNAFTMSRGGQLPVIDALKSLRDIWTESEDYQLYLANGGGFGYAVGDEAKRVRLRLKGTGVTLRGILDTPAAIADVWDKWGQSFELATRLAEFKKVRKQGKSLREAAYQGREISTDFAVHGNAALARWAMISIGFFNARLQGLYRLERELFERQGRQSWRGERMLAYASRALTGLTMPSVLIYLLLNRDDEDYEALPEEVKSLYTVIPAPDGGVYLIPRPFETGALFQEIPIRMLEYYLDGQDEKLVDAFKFMVTETFAFSPFPQIAQPVIDVGLNRKWNGLPIVPRSLEDIEPEEQFQPWTPKTYRKIGERFGVSPLKLQALVEGYFGSISGYVVAATDALVSAGDETGEEPRKRLSSYPVLRRFIREQPYTSTSYEKAFYEMLDEVTIVANTARKKRREARADDFERYLGQAEREVLFGLEGITRRVADRAAEINATIRRIQDDPTMTADEKREEIDRLQAEQNKLFKEVTELTTPKGLERLIEALETQ